MSDHRHTRPTPVNQRNCFVNTALIGTVGDNSHGFGTAPRKSGRVFATGVRPVLAQPARRHLIVLAERLERQAEEIEKQFENAAAPGRQDEAGNSESDGPDG